MSTTTQETPQTLFCPLDGTPMAWQRNTDCKCPEGHTFIIYFDDHWPDSHRVTIKMTEVLRWR